MVYSLDFIRLFGALPNTSLKTLISSAGSPGTPASAANASAAVENAPVLNDALSIYFAVATLASAFAARRCAGAGIEMARAGFGRMSPNRGSGGERATARSAADPFEELRRLDRGKSESCLQ